MKAKQNILEKVTDKISVHLLPIGEKMSKSKLFSAISETTQASMAIIIIGSFAMLIPELGIDAWQKLVWSIPHLGDLCYKIYCCTCGFYSLYLVFILAYNYSKKIGLKENIGCGAISLAVFFLITPFDAWAPLPVDWTGTKGVIAAMIIGVLVPTIVKAFFNKKIYIRMPSSVPQFIEASFKILIPTIALFAMSSILNILIGMTPFGDIQNAIYTMIQTPLKTVGLSLPGMCLVMALTNLVWWCGIHGDAANAAYYTLAEVAALENLNAMYTNAPLPNIITSGLLNSTIPGGYGQMMIPAIIAVFMCKSKELKSIGEAAIVPSLFNIGEPVLFGLPVMFNALLFIPLILGQVVNCVFWYAVIRVGLVGPFSGVSVSWACPQILMQFLGSTTPVRAVIAELVMIICDILIWLPFMKVYDRQQVEIEASEMQG